MKGAERGGRRHGLKLTLKQEQHCETKDEGCKQLRLAVADTQSRLACARVPPLLEERIAKAVGMYKARLQAVDRI
jgi:hypothetical protein